VGFFKKNWLFSSVGSNYINTEDNYGRSIEFEPKFKTVLTTVLFDFMMHH